mgnify:CR=1 FL=1
MQTIIHRKSKGVTIRYTVEDEPTLGTLGNYRLLIEQYIVMERCVNFKQLLFNTYFLRKMKSYHKKLHCVYCGKKIYEFTTGGNMQEISIIWLLLTISLQSLSYQKYLLWMKIISV